MVVGVPHGPAAGVTLGLLAVCREHESTVSISPLGPGRQSALYLKQKKYLSSVLFYEYIFYFYPVNIFDSMQQVPDCERARVSESLVMREEYDQTLSHWAQSHKLILSL